METEPYDPEILHDDDFLSKSLFREKSESEKSQERFWLWWIVAIGLGCLMAVALRDPKPRNYGDSAGEFECPDFH